MQWILIVSLFLFHCSYHYKVDSGSDDLLAAAATSAARAPWLYDLWVLAAVLGCLAFNIKMVTPAAVATAAVLYSLYSLYYMCSGEQCESGSQRRGEDAEEQVENRHACAALTGCAVLATAVVYYYC